MNNFVTEKNIQSPTIEIPIEICREDVILPEYANPHDAGMDIRAAEDVVIKPNETVVIPTGLKMAIPEGYEIQVRPRSGLSLKTPLRVSNSPGTVDSGFKDEIGVIMTNTSIENYYDNQGFAIALYLDSKGNKQGTYVIKKGDRIAQIVLQVVPKIKFTVVDSVKDIGSNRNGGFGSTGTK